MFYLMRHGEASWAANTDIDRELTQQGRNELTQLSHQHHDSLLSIQKIVCSPYLRTQQTAKIIAASIGIDKLEYEGRLTPENSIKDVMAALEKHWCDNLLMVTHQPLIGNLISYLEQGDFSQIESVSPGSMYAYSMEWPGPGCALRESLFLV